MIVNKSQQKIKTLINDIHRVNSNQNAKKIIAKYYDLASTINQQMPSQKNQQLLTLNQKSKKQKLTDHLHQLKQLFQKFKSQKSHQIIKFDQVESYMYQETERILLKYQPSFLDLVFHKITQIKKLFMISDLCEERYPQIASDTSEWNSGSKSLEQNRNFPEIKTSFVSNKINIKDNQVQDLSPKSFSKSWDTIKFYYDNHRLDEAYNQLMRYQKYYNIHLKSKQMTQNQKQLAETIKFQYKTINEFYEHFYDTGYTFDKQQKGISLWYKIIGQKDVAIKVQAEVDISIQNFLCISSEINLFEDYIPFTYDTKELKSISRNEKIGTSKIYIPLLTDRQTYFYAAAYDRLRTKGSIFFFSKTINQDTQYQQKYDFKVPQTSDFIRLEYKYYILEYVPITKNRGKIKMVSSIDLKMDYLPLFIINKSARIFSFDYMKNYQKINSKFAGSKWDKVKKQKKQLYDYFQQKINEYLEQKQK